VQKKGLGRGLEALIPNFSPGLGAPLIVEDEQNVLLQNIPVSKIVPNPNQPRKHFDDEALADLVVSVKEHGLLQPVVVRAAGAIFELVVGERRWRAARKAAEGVLSRNKRILIRTPDWLSDDAKKIFENTKRRMRGLGLLDNVDADLLALYSDAIVQYQKDDQEIREKQAWSRVVLSYAEKLGISPSARTRLAKKSAENLPPDDLEQLLDDVTDFVNGDV